LGGFARLFGNYKLDMKGISGSFAFAKRLYSLLVVVEYVADPEFGLGIRLGIWASNGFGIWVWTVSDALKAASMISESCRAGPV
jgi:hypothetical protein